MRTNVPGVRTLVLIFALALSSLRGFSQSITTSNGSVELGLGIGPLIFLGDLGGNYGKGTRFVKDLNFSTINLIKGLHVTVYPVEWLGFRFAINQGKLEGYDSVIHNKGGDEFYREKRNLQFQSPLWEVYGAIELYPTVFIEQYDGLQGKLRPYGILGFGAFKFNPKGKYYAPDGTASWVNLKPLRTEGQGIVAGRNEYKLMSWEIPIGAGVKYYLKENFYLGLEIMHRKSFTDYVDDVSTTYIDNSLFASYLSPEQAAMANQLYFREGFVPPGGALARTPTVGEQRGNSKQNDSYFSTIIRMGWRLNGWNSSREAKQMRCPTFY